MTEIKPEQLQDVEAEKAVLGALFFCGLRKLADIFCDSKICLEDFTSEKNRLVFSAVLELYQEGVDISSAVVAVKLKEGGKVEAVEAVTLVGELTAKAVPDLAYMAKRLRQLTGKRRLAAALGECQQLLMENELTPERALSLVLGASSGQSARGRGLKSANDYLVHDGLADALLDGEYIKGLPSGFDALDELTGGFKPGQFILLAARPSMGKSALASNITLNVLQAGGKVAFFSLEMAAPSIISRMVSELVRKDIRKAGEQEIISAFGKLAEVGLKLQDASSERLSVSSIRLELLRQRAQGWKPDLVVVDYLGLIQPDNRKATAYEQVTEISKSLKLLAVEVGAPFLVLAQLNRAVEGRQNKQPLLSDLRDSGGLEQDADIVLGLYREGYYTKDRRNNTAELHVLKVRDGGHIGAVPLYFEGEQTTFIGLPAGRWEKAGGEWVGAGACELGRNIR